VLARSRAERFCRSAKRSRQAHRLRPIRSMGRGSSRLLSRTQRCPETDPSAWTAEVPSPVKRDLACFLVDREARTSVPRSRGSESGLPAAHNSFVTPTTPCPTCPSHGAASPVNKGEGRDRALSRALERRRT